MAEARRSSRHMGCRSSSVAAPEVATGDHMGPTGEATQQSGEATHWHGLPKILFGGVGGPWQGRIGAEDGGGGGLEGEWSGEGG